jgi:hypothetical protein
MDDKNFIHIIEHQAGGHNTSNKLSKYEKLTVVELKTMAKERNIPQYYKMNKAELDSALHRKNKYKPRV